MHITNITTKHTPSDLDILDVIKHRWSPRSFSDRPIDQEVLNRLFEAARWAPSAMNEQPWRFVVGLKGTDTHQQIVDGLLPGNQPWALKAPILVISIVKNTYSKTGVANTAAPHDLGLAVGNLNAQATHEGLGVHQMGGIDKKKLANSFRIPNDYDIVTVIALGYFGNPDDLSEELRIRELAPRTRKPLNEIVYYGNFK